MSGTEARFAGWLTGVRPPTISGRTVVLESAEWLTALRTAGFLDDGGALLIRGPSPAAADRTWTHECFTGDLRTATEDLAFASGLRVAQCPYGLAEFHSFDGPVALRITDDHDFSAFLRDADGARATGRFARPMTNPLTILADRPGLGATPATGGPGQRIFVSDIGAVSTSPTGLRLGWVGEGPTAIERRWVTANERSRRPCAVCLSTVVAERDRVEALLERPWLARYLDAVAVLQEIRREHLEPGRVSGFGGRLTAGVAWDGGTDDARAPLLVEAGAGVRAVDPRGRRWLALSAEAVAAVEALLSPGGPGRATARIDHRATSAGGATNPEVAGLLDRLGRAGIAPDWVVAMRQSGPGQRSADDVPHHAGSSRKAERS